MYDGNIKTHRITEDKNLNKRSMLTVSEIPGIVEGEEDIESGTVITSRMCDFLCQCWKPSNSKLKENSTENLNIFAKSCENDSMRLRI